MGFNNAIINYIIGQKLEELRLMACEGVGNFPVAFFDFGNQKAHSFGRLTVLLTLTRLGTIKLWP